MSLLSKLSPPPPFTHCPPARLQVESLETRLVPYSVSGNAWVHPEVVTISFVPDGTNLGGQTSNLFSTMNARFGSASTWQNQILKAAQVWAQQTNVNLAVVSDNGGDSGSGSYQQGDSGFGDIRIGGYNFGFGSNALALADLPPQINNYSVAGDIAFNTGMSFNIGSNYDLFTVAMHEFGHALGLDHSGSGGAVMYPTYSSPKTALNSDDIAGIRNIYSNNSARSGDANDALLSNGSFLTATNLTLAIDQVSLTALANNLNITTTSDSDYYTFLAPLGTSGSMTVNVQSSGLSLLAPGMTVYAGDMTTVLGTASYTGTNGGTLSVTVNNVVPLQAFYVKVNSAVTTAFGTGDYAMTLNFGTGAAPTVPLANTQTANGDPLSGGGGIAYSTDANSGDYRIGRPRGDLYSLDPLLVRSHEHASTTAVLTIITTAAQAVVTHDSSLLPPAIFTISPLTPSAGGQGGHGDSSLSAADQVFASQGHSNSGSSIAASLADSLAGGGNWSW